MRDSQADPMFGTPDEELERLYREDCAELRPQGLAPLAIILLGIALAVVGLAYLL